LTRNQALLIAFLFLFGYWYFSPSLFSYFVGVKLPIIGPILGTSPFAFLTEYTVLVGGGLAVILFYMMTKKGAKET